MTEKNLATAKIWIESFIFSRGFLEPQHAFIAEKFTQEQIRVTSVELLSDPDARPALIDAYRSITRYHNHTEEQDSAVADEIRMQINLARSLVIFNELGQIND